MPARILWAALVFLAGCDSNPGAPTAPGPTPGAQVAPTPYATKGVPQKGPVRATTTNPTE